MRSRALAMIAAAILAASVAQRTILLVPLEPVFGGDWQRRARVAAVR